MVKEGALVGERFRIERLHSRGGMGAVFRGVDTTTNAPVAVKILHGSDEPELVERFMQEARLLAELRHPHIVRHVAHGATPDGDRYLVMEWLDGVDLHTRLGDGRLSIDESVGLARRIAEALAVAHERGVIHRDIKPANVFLPLDAPITSVRLLDFGIARVGHGAGTRTGLRVGTPRYMAPEQARGVRQLDARTDLFGLGCVLYECLTGEPAFAGDDELAVLARILLGETRPPRELRADIPPPLDALVTRLLAREPAARPSSADEVARQLAALASHGDAPSLPLRLDAGTPQPVLTGDEQRILSVVLVAGETLRPPRDLDSDPTHVEAPHGRLSRLVREHGGRYDELADGSIVIEVAGAGGASDQAASAASLALALRPLVSGSPIALATGRGLVAGQLPLGEVIDRAVALVRTAEARPPGIAVDAVAASLLEARFAIERRGEAFALLGERSTLEVRATLLGRATPFVGRERELGLLNAIFDECAADGVARAALVTAPAGVGKSRLAAELVAAVRKRAPECAIWIGRADHLRAGAPYGLVARALRSELGILDGQPADTQRQRLLDRLRGVLAPPDALRVAELVAELLGVPFPTTQNLQLQAARGNAQIMADLIRRGFTELIAAETAARPLLIVLEDLHWGDLPTVRLLDAALRDLPSQPWMVLGLGRPQVHEQFPRLWADRALTEMSLGELSARAAERLVRGVLPALTDGVRGRIVAQAAGNPFFLEELIRAVSDGKADALPETVLAMIEARLQRLPAEARRVLRAASTFGLTFWRAGVEALLGDATRRSHTVEWLDELCERELIAQLPETRFPGEPAYGFRHALVADAAYRMLTPDDRRLAHRLAAEWLTRAGESDAALLATHFEHGGTPGDAVPWYRRAAEQALDANDLLQVLAHVASAVRCGASGENLGALRFVEAMAHRWLGQYAEAEAAGAEALAILPRGSVAWYRAVRPFVSALAARGKQLDALPFLEEARHLPANEVPSPEQVIAWGSAANDLFYGGYYDIATHLVAIVERADGTLAQAPIAEGYLYRARSFRCNFAGDLAASIPLSEISARAFERGGDRRNHALERMNTAMSYIALGDWAESERGLTEALALARPLGLAYLDSAIRQALVLALEGLGRLDEAESLGREVLQIFSEMGEGRMVASSRLYLASILGRRGDEGRTAALAEADAAVTASLPYAPILAAALALRAELRLPSDVPAALTDAHAAMAELGRLGSIDEGEARVRLTYARALAAAGDAAAATAALADARTRLLDRASRIGDPELRRRFLDEVDVHRDTIAGVS